MSAGTYPLAALERVRRMATDEAAAALAMAEAHLSAARDREANARRALAAFDAETDAATREFMARLHGTGRANDVTTGAEHLAARRSERAGLVRAIEAARGEAETLDQERRDAHAAFASAHAALRAVERHREAWERGERMEALQDEELEAEDVAEARRGRG